MPRSRSAAIHSLPSTYSTPWQPPPPSGIWRCAIVFAFMSVWKIPFGAAFAPIQMKPPPMPMPLVFFDSVLTVLSSLPFQSTRHALSVFCSPIQRPSGATAIAFGYPSGLLKSVVVLALRTGSDEAPRPAGAGACA